MFKAAVEGKVKGLSIRWERTHWYPTPTATMWRRGRAKTLEFYVVQDIFLTESAKYAHVVLPAASFAEKEGTFTNTERKVQLLHRAVPSPGDARPDGEIIVDLANRMGAAWSYDDPAAVMAEIAALTPSYGGISAARLAEGGLCWPCPSADHPGTPILHVDQFTRGKGPSCRSSTSAGRRGGRGVPAHADYGTAAGALSHGDHDAAFRRPQRVGADRLR